MKLFYVIFLILPLSCYSFPSSEKPIVVAEENDLTAKESSQITKRSGGGGGGSGSFDFITHLKSSLIGGFGKASASLSSGSSGSSSGPKSHGNSYGHGNSVDFDPWSLKKSVLNTIFQAVKAITGGVTAIKGQLIKGSGYAIAASGNLVASSGDKVTEVGKAIVNSAQLVHPPPKHGHGGYGHTGGEHPFAKFSSLSGASSGGSSGGGHPATSVEVHGETVETYEIPSGPAVHHPSAHYGPPIKASYLPAHAGYSGGPYGGAVAYEGPESYNNYNGHKGPIKTSSHNNYHNFKDTVYPLTKAETQKATLALKEIIHLLPLAKTATKSITATTSTGGTTSTGHDISGHNTNTNHLTGSDNSQHDDNKDNYNNYDHQSKPLGPIETVEVTQSLTTAYGLPRDFEPNNTGTDGSSVANGYNLNSNKNSHSENTIYNPHPFEVYQAMSNKYKTQQQHIVQNHQSQNQNFNTQNNNNNNDNNYNNNNHNNNYNNNYNNNNNNNNNYNSHSGNSDNLNTNSINSIGPLLVAIGATNTYPYKRHVNNQIADEYDSKYNPNRVNLYLQELNPQLLASIASTNPYSHQPVPQFPSQTSDQLPIHPLQLPQLPVYPTQLPFLSNPQFNQNKAIIQTVTARNDRPFRKRLPPGVVHHIKTKGKKILKNNLLGSLPNKPLTTAHGFDGQNMFLLQ